METMTSCDKTAGQDREQGEFALRMENFSFAYPRAATPVLEHVDVTIAPGEFVLLSGATGSGKTTFLRCFKPEITPVGERSGVAETRGTCGYVAQNPETQIVCDTVWHEMAFGLENAGVPADEMRMRVAEVAYFFGMEPWFNAKVHELSGGRKQLLNLAAVLALRPSILLLDEPTAQLDPLAARDFAHALFRVNRELGLTVVVATHDPRLLANYATRFLRLEDGRVEEETTGRSACLDESGRSGCHASHSIDSSGVTATSLKTSRTTRCLVAVTCREVFASYGKDTPPVLRGVNLEVAAGSIHALIGGNGSGKTTLLAVIAGVMDAYRGKVRKADPQATQGYLPQDPHALFLADTVDEELRLWQKTCSAPYSREDIAAVLARFGLTDCTSQHPYDLSGGQQQLLAFAKLALVHPDLYLLDEPMKGLDARRKGALMEALRQEAARGATIIVATHDLGFVAELADAVSFIFDGQIATTEPPAAFFARNLFFRPFVAETATAAAAPETATAVAAPETALSGAEAPAAGEAPAR